MVWILLILLNIYAGANCLLLNPQQSCVPTTTVKGPCHVCVCDTHGVFICHAIECQNIKVNPRISMRGECQPKMTYRYEELFCICSYEGKWMSLNCRETFRSIKQNRTLVKPPMRSNITSNITKIDKKKLPQIRDGQSCVSGNMYRMSCNTCKCGDNNRLICTKMACLESAILKKKITKHSIRTGRQGTEEKHKKKLNNKKKARKIKKLPKLPEGDCVPGRVYAKGCNKCFCNNQKYAVCTVTCRDEDLLNNRLSDEDILEIETRSEDDLATLPHLGTECVPGQSHFVECNVCLCSERRDLICTRRYCLNMMSYSENLIDNYEGKPCVRDFKQFCVSCTCVNKKMTCKVLDNCNSIMTGKQLLSDGNKVVKLALNAAKDQCTPNVIYKVHCNDCYCQPEGGLRCTQKMCLTYSQIKDLQEREVYLEKYGL